jgi:hypothetical protein
LPDPAPIRPAPQPASRSRQPAPRSIQIALFFTGLLWLLASHAVAVRAAAGLSARFNAIVAQPALSELFFLFLLLVGFTLLSWVGLGPGSVAEANALPDRPSAPREWLVGAAIGWAALLVAVLPMVLAGSLHPQFWAAPRAWEIAFLSLLALAIGSLANEVAFRGFLFRRLIEATGPFAATVLLSGLYAVLGFLRPNATALGFVVTFLAGLLFSTAYLRTHALWLGWGLHFAWAASTAVLLGLPIGGQLFYSGLIQTSVSGPLWLTGGAYGPEGAIFTAIVLLGALAILYRATRDYAWSYTQTPIVPAGYPMDVPPPAEHTRMEQAAAPPPLVQIAPVAAATPPPLRPPSQTVPTSSPDTDTNPDTDSD